MSTEGRILVIDDEIDVCNLLKKVLEDEGYSVEVATSGEDGVQKAKSEKFNLVTLDIKMPGMDGMKTLQKIKNVQPDVCVVMVTVVTDLSQAAQAARLGAYDYITKPFDLDKLKTVVKNGVKGCQLVR